MMEKRKKIAFFLFGGAGGAERMTLNYGKLLPKECYEVVYVICGRARGIENFIPEGYEVRRIPWVNTRAFPRLRIWHMMRSIRPDYVFSSTMQLNVLLLAAASFLKVPCIVRNDSMVRLVNSKVVRQMARWYPTAARIVAQTEEMKADLDALLGYAPDDAASPVVCIHNMVDEETIGRALADAGNPYGEGVNYVSVANFLPLKGHDTLIPAFAIVHDHNPSAQLYLVGGKVDPEYDNYIRVKGYVDAAGLEDSVHFMGFQKNPYQWMKYADCLTLQSTIEGLPNVLLEAMYLGTPVVSTRCVPVVDRMVEEGVNGYKIEVGDVEALAAAMEKAIALKDVKLTFSCASVSDIENLFE